MPVFKDEVNCKSSRALECGQAIAGFDIYAQILTILAWISVILGLVSVITSVRLRRERAILRNLPTVPGYHHLNTFELFLLFYTLSCVAGTVALTLSAFLNTTSLVFYCLMSIRNLLVFVALYLFTDMMLSVNSNNDGYLKAIQTIYLKLLFIPNIILFGSFIYQGYLSDIAHKDGAATRTDKIYSQVVAANQICLLVVFLFLNILVIIARIRFSKYLAGTVELALLNERMAVNRMHMMAPDQNKTTERSTTTVLGTANIQDDSRASLENVDIADLPRVRAVGSRSLPGNGSRRGSIDTVPINSSSRSSHIPSQNAIPFNSNHESPRRQSVALDIRTGGSAQGTTSPSTEGSSNKIGSDLIIRSRERSPSVISKRRGSAASVHRSQTTDMARQLRSSIVTMKWLITALTLFLVYSALFAAFVLYLGYPKPVYFLTLAINWWMPVKFGTVIFAIVIIQKYKQFRDLWVEMEEGDEWIQNIVSPVGSHQ